MPDGDDPRAFYCGVRTFSGGIPDAEELHRADPGGGWQIRSLHVAEPGSSQRGEEHYPQTLVMERIVRQRQELLNRKRQSGDLLRVHRHHRPAGGTGRGASSLQQYPGRGVPLPL